MRRQLYLSFASADEPQLLEIRFSHDWLTQEIKGVRGSMPGAHIGYSTFRWSPAVHALCILLVETAAGAKAPQQYVYPYLEGEKGSAAASLDFAITKQPNWTIDLFGCDRRGNSYLKRIVCRSNSEQKRPGPVRLALHNRLFPASCITVVLDGKELSTESRLKELAFELKRSWEGKKNCTSIARSESQVEEQSTLPAISRMARACATAV